MSFPAYAEYKDSGVEWLGEVPGHWEVGGLKRYVAIVGGSTPKSEVANYWGGNIPWVTPADLSRLTGFGICDTLRKITSEGLDSCGTTLVPPGSVILSTRAPIGSLGIAKVALCTNQGCKALVPNKIDEKFLAYLLSISSSELNVRGRGSTFLELSADELGAFRIACPPPAEQTAIAAFLDRETAKIDALVAEQQRLIALLQEKRQAAISHAVTKGLNPSAPMKDSGIEWLGEVPAHWDICSLSYRYNVALGKMLDEKNITGNFLRPYLRNTDIQWGKINTDDLPLMDFKPDEINRYSIFQDDLIVCEGGEVGRSAIWTHEDPVCYQKALHRLRPYDTTSETTRFAFFLFEMSAKSGVFTASEGKSTIAHLPAEKLRRYKFAFPPFEEQLQIADHLEDISRRWDILEADAQSAITLLQERRAALISAAVTGKIDARTLAPSANEREIA